VKVAIRILPPVIVELPQEGKEKYSGPELILLRCILDRLNLSVEYKVLISTNKSQFEAEANFIEEAVSGDADISVGALTINERIISHVDWTVSYFESGVKWYVPCASLAKPWRALLGVYTPGMWICVLCTFFPIVIFMHYLATLVRKYQLRESHIYMTFQSCVFIYLSMALNVPVAELPRTCILRTFVFIHIYLSFFVTTVVQNYFTTFLLNPGFEKQISNISEIIQSGIQYSYTIDTDEPLKYFVNEYEYDIMQQRRIMCDNHCHCLALMLKNENFACVSSTLCADILVNSPVTNYEYARRHVCVLPNEIDKIRRTMYLKRGHPFLSHFDKNIRRMIENGLMSKWRRDFKSKQTLIFVSSSLSYGKDSFGTKNIVSDSIYEEGYFALSVTHLTAPLHSLVFGFSLSLIALIAELVYRRLHYNT
jgi:hypothetical protein